MSDIINLNPDPFTALANTMIPTFVPVSWNGVQAWLNANEIMRLCETGEDAPIVFLQARDGTKYEFDGTLAELWAKATIRPE